MLKLIVCEKERTVKLNKLLTEIAYCVTPSRKPFWVQELPSAPAVSAGSGKKFNFFPVAGMIPFKNTIQNISFVLKFFFVFYNER